jgi:hypothetical protein
LEQGHFLAQGGLHLRIEDASILLNDADSLIESRDSVVATVNVTQNGSQVQSQLLWVKFGCEDVGQAMLLASWDLDIVSFCRQVAHDARALRIEVCSPEATANEVDSYGFGLFIGEGKEGLCRLAIDELDAEDLSAWEGG